MHIRYDITHTTLYRYREPVSFGEHRVMFRPRDSHDLRVLATDLVCSPEAKIRLIQDPHSNSIALLTPRGQASELKIVCTFTIEYAPGDDSELALSPSALIFPFAYAVQERMDLEHYMRPLHDDPDGVLTQWARQFMRTDGHTVTRELLLQMNGFIREKFVYAARDEEGTQTPLQTLKQGSGSCRDFALLMMEAVRSLGMAARFVTGYLYDPVLDPSGGDDGSDDTEGAGSTHAWLQVYLPGAGWVPFDPTNNLRAGSAQLIRVGVARDPRQAAPVSGSWFGPPEAYLGLSASVLVRRVA